MVVDDYVRLVDDGIVLCDGVVAREGGAAAWADALIARAERDGLSAGLVYFMMSDTHSWEAVELLRPDGTRYRYEGENRWLPEGLSRPDVEAAAAGIRPLAERDWGKTLERARAQLR
jgi:hypothetical protein